MSTTRSFGWVFGGTLLQILLQFLLQRTFASLFGAAADMDAYRAALTFPAAISGMLVGTIVPILIPKVADGKNLVVVPPILVIVGGSTIFLCVLAYFFVEQIAAGWLAGFDGVRKQSFINVFRILIWLLPANSMLGVLQGLHHSQKSFALPVIAGALGPLATLIIMRVYAPEYGTMACAYATLVGAYLNLVIQSPIVLAILPERSKGAIRDLLPMFQRSFPVLASMIVLKLDPFVERYVLAFHGPGNIAHLDYAVQITTIFISLSSGALSTVAFPQLASAWSQGSKAIEKEVAGTFRTFILLIVPAVVVMTFFSHALVKDLFETGEFGRSDTNQVAMILQVYTCMIVGAGIGEITTKILYVFQDTWTPMWIGSGLILVGMIVKVLIVPQGTLMTYVWVVGLVYFPGTLLSLVAVYWRIGTGMFDGLGSAFGVAVSGSILAALIGKLVLNSTLPFSGVTGLIAGGLAYLLFAWGAMQLCQPNEDCADC